MCYTRGPATRRPFTYNIFRPAILLHIETIIIALELDTSPNPTLHNLIHFAKNTYKIKVFLLEIMEMKMRINHLLQFQKNTFLLRVLRSQTVLNLQIW